MYSILASSCFTYAETVKTVFLKSFVTDSLHALHLLLKLTFYFCFLEAVIIHSNKHIFIASTISLHLAPRSFPLCPPSSNLPMSSHSEWIISVPSGRKKISSAYPFVLHKLPISPETSFHFMCKTYRLLQSSCKALTHWVRAITPGFQPDVIPPVPVIGLFLQPVSQGIKKEPFCSCLLPSWDMFLAWCMFPIWGMFFIWDM